MQPPPSRMAPCPCGSGKRYKECHGALGVRPEYPPTAVVSPSAAVPLLDRALAAQRAGRLGEAIAGYEAALALEPRSFDALHMLGVALYQRGQFEAALARIDAAIAVRGDVAAAHFNRNLVEKSIAKRRQTERELAPAILPRFAPLCADAEPWPRCLAAGEPMHVVVAKAHVDGALADAIAALVRALPVAPALWARADADIDADAAARLGRSPTAVDPAQLLHPREGNLVFAGIDARATAWLPNCRPSRVALLCDDYAPGPLIDRLRELSDEGRRRVALVYPDAALARRVRLPGAVLADRVPVASQ